LSLPDFELKIFLLAPQILNPHANRTLRERLGEKNTFDHNHIKTDETMHPRRER